MNKEELLKWFVENFSQLRKDRELISAIQKVYLTWSIAWLSMCATMLVASYLLTRLGMSSSAVFTVLVGLNSALFSMLRFKSSCQQEYEAPPDELSGVPTRKLLEIYERYNKENT